MAGILEKRNSLHRQLADQRQLNNELKVQIGQMRPLANIGMVSAMAAHEMNNILTPLGSYAQLAIDNPDDRDLTWKTIQKTATNSERAAKILETILAMANGKKLGKKKSKLKTLVDETFTFIIRNFEKDNIKVSIHIPDGLTIWAEGISLQQVLINLILNAREAMSAKGKKGGNLKISAHDLHDSIKIEVTDTGCGIEPENLKKIFDSFYTTKTHAPTSKRTGAGLGLAFCKNVIEAHNGMISVESKQGLQTTFKIILPKN